MPISLGSSRVINSVLIFGVAVSITLCTYLLSGCAFLCSAPGDMHPAALLEENDFVLLGKLASVDTLASIGTVVWILDDYEAYIVEYTYYPEDVIKGEADSRPVYLWITVLDEAEGDRSSAPSVSDTSLELVYGNKLRNWADIISVQYTESTASLAELRGSSFDSSSPRQWNSWKCDSAIAAWLQTADGLKKELSDRLKTGSVIYGTDAQYRTHDSYVRYGSLDICDWRYFFEYNVTSAQYVEWLKDLAD